MAQIIKKGPSWMVRVTWRDADGKQHKKSKSGFKTKAAARKAGAEMESSKYHGVLSTADPIFTDYYQNWYETYKHHQSSRRTIPLRVDTLNNKSVISRGCFEWEHIQRRKN